VSNKPSQPLQIPVDVDGGALSLPWSQWLSYAARILKFIVIDFSNASLLTPVTGFSIIIGDAVQVVTFNPAGTLASGTLTTPANPADGQPLEVNTTQTITALTFQPSAGQTVNNAPTTLAAGSGFGYYYNAALATWFRRF
jgi:hypothetical protein